MSLPKRQAIVAYFTLFPRWAVWAALLAVAGIVVQGWLFAYGLGWIVIAIAGATIASWSRRPTDDEVDILTTLLDTTRKNSDEKQAWTLVARAILNLDETITRE